ncbi:MAG: PorV/PorQ family protein [Rhodothermaceae bacterium]|nr:PorV/PorQ family protein [Rhodothermaceae bacterium]
MSKHLLLASALGLLVAGSAFAQDQSGTTAAAFLGLGIDARGTAMGSAQVATAEGPAALFWNPAAIATSGARAGTGAALFSNSDWFVHTRHQFFGLTFNGGGLGTFGLSVTALDYGDELVTTVDQPEGTGELYTALDLAVGVSYGRALTDRFAFGGTVKLVRQQIWNESANGAAVDLGVVYDTGYRGLTIGMAMTNFGSDMKLSGRDLRQRIDIAPNQGGNNDGLPAELEVSEWRLPLIFRVGVAADAFRTSDQALTVAVEGLAPSDNSQSANVGAEYSFRELLYVRGGYRQAFSSITEDGGWAVGFGLKYAFTNRLGASFDYVFQEYEPFGTPQMFSLGVTF